MSHLSTTFLAVAAVALGRAIHVNNGFYDPEALLLLSLSFALTSAAVVTGRSAAVAPPEERAVSGGRLGPVIVLAAGLAWQLATLLTAKPAMYIKFTRPIDLPAFFWGLVGVAILSVLVVVGRSRRLRMGALALTFAVHAWLGATILRASPDPRIDVVTVHDEAVAALRTGRSPYSITFENIYGDSQFYNPALTSGGRVLFGLPYPPLSLLMTAPATWLVGDYRYALLAALIGAGVLIAYAPRHAGPLAERQAALAALLLLFTPRVFFQIEQGWTEPLLVLLLATTVATARRAPRLSAPAAGLLLAVKQYVVVMLPLMPLLWPRQSKPRLAIAAFTATAVTLPFVLWDPTGFLKSVVLVQLAEPFRVDSLSYVSWMSRHGLVEPRLWITIGAAGAAVALGLWRLPRTPVAFAAGSALVALASFAFGKKAFCNYYFFVIAALVTAVGMNTPAGPVERRN